MWFHSLHRNCPQEWRKGAVKEQKKIPDHENPTLLVETIGSKIYALEREMKYLINKAKNFRPKPKMKTENATSKANKTEADSTVKKSNETKPEDSAESEDDTEATVEVEDDETTTTVPESQGR